MQVRGKSEARSEKLREIACSEVLNRIEKELVGRDGIEPPTPGFSVLFSDSRKCAQLLATQSLPHRLIVRPSALE